MFKRIFLLILLVFGSGCGVMPGVSEFRTPSPDIAPIEQVLNGTQRLVAGEPLIYKGIIPGKSTRNDVEARWGSPNAVRRFEEYESLHYYDSQGFMTEYFLIRNGVVQAITSLVYTPTEMEDRRLFGIKEDQLMKDSTMITPTLGSSSLRSPFPRIQVFPQYGLAISGNGIYQFFMPTSLEGYQRTWGTYPLGIDPFPLVPSVDGVGIRLGQTTREDLDKLLGTPDRIHATGWVYEMEPDTLGRLSITFGKDGTVQSMSGDQINRRITFDEIVTRYGVPDIVQLIPDHDGTKYDKQALVYLQRGLRLMAFCPNSKCEVVRRNTVVLEKWYFPPTSLTEYQEKLTKHVFIPWHGFDDWSANLFHRFVSGSSMRNAEDGMVDTLAQPYTSLSLL